MRCKNLAILALLLICGCSITKKQAAISTEDPVESKQAAYFIPVPITKFSSIQSPCVDVEIDGNYISMELDLGYRGDLTVTNETKDLISSKSFVREKPMYGIRGKQYPTNVYRIPKARIGKMTFLEPLLQEGTQEFIQDATFVQNEGAPSPRESGRLGWEIFYKVNLLIDIKHTQIAFCDSINTLQTKGFAIETFTATPLFLERGLVEFNVITPRGALRCMLDTGSTWNILNSAIKEGQSMNQAMWDPNNIVEYSSLKIEGKDFGPTVFHRIPITVPIRIEAILGMEFLQDHLVFLDFAGKRAYFAKEHWMTGTSN